MRNPFNHPAMIDISLLLGRIALGLYVALSGWRRITGGVSGFVNGTVMLARPGWIPESIARPYGYAMPFLEVAAGLLLALGLFTRPAAGVVTLVLMTIAGASIGAYGMSGGADGPFHFSVALATLAFILAIIGSGRLALDPLYFGGGGGK